MCLRHEMGVMRYRDGIQTIMSSELPMQQYGDSTDRQPMPPVVRHAHIFAAVLCYYATMISYVFRTLFCFVAYCAPRTYLLQHQSVRMFLSDLALYTSSRSMPPGSYTKSHSFETQTLTYFRSQNPAATSRIYALKDKACGYVCGTGVHGSSKRI